MNAFPTGVARDRFFSEEPGFERPFKDAAWRGCVLDRDKYSNARLPENLWRSLVRASGTSTVLVCGYYSDRERCAAVDAEWRSYSEYMLAQSNYSPEYVIYDESGKWAILADVDVTTLGLAPELADSIDLCLSADKTSLLGLTRGDFQDKDILSPGGVYIRGVLGMSAAALAEERD